MKNIDTLILELITVLGKTYKEELYKANPEVYKLKPDIGEFWESYKYPPKVSNKLMAMQPMDYLENRPFDTFDNRPLKICKSEYYISYDQFSYWYEDLVNNPYNCSFLHQVVYWDIAVKKKNESAEYEYTLHLLVLFAGLPSIRSLFIKVNPEDISKIKKMLRTTALLSFYKFKQVFK